jgi:hypothetical protein
MSVNDAMRFIARVRNDENLQTELRELGIDPDLSEVAALGARLGLTFSIAELRSAYGYEWTMRSIHHGLLKKPD